MPARAEKTYPTSQKIETLDQHLPYELKVENY